MYYGKDEVNFVNPVDSEIVIPDHQYQYFAISFLSESFGIIQLYGLLFHVNKNLKSSHPSVCSIKFVILN